MNRASKGWATRYKNEIAIIKEQLEAMSEELYKQFLEFVNNTAKYQELTRQYTMMCKELERFEWKHKGGLSS